MKTSPARRILRIAAALLFAGIVALWASTGAHRGWTKTQLTEMHRDEITGIDYPVQRDGWVVGVDLLGIGIGVSLVLLAASAFVGRRRAEPAA